MAALKDIWTAWEYNRFGNLPDGNPDLMRCPNLGNVANHRVSCDDDGFLNDITLGHDFLYGDIARICALSNADVPTRLRTLTLSANYLWGTLPDCVSKFTDVRQFWIDHNFVRGQLPSLAAMTNINEQADSSDCRLVSKGYLVEHFGEDENCFECDGGFTDLPGQCAAFQTWPNRCKLYKGVDVDACPSGNGMPARPDAPSKGSCGAGSKGTKNCMCNTGGNCAGGLTCNNNNMCVPDAQQPSLCQMNPASLGCPCNANTGQCADDTLMCRRPELICVRMVATAAPTASPIAPAEAVAGAAQTIAIAVIVAAVVCCFAVLVAVAVAVSVAIFIYHRQKSAER